MKNNKLNKEEKELLKEFESNEFKKIRGVEKEKDRYKKHAKETLSKRRSINIRISERDLQKLKVLAAEKGLPYQTLISSLLHQHINKKNKENVFHS